MCSSSRPSWPGGHAQGAEGGLSLRDLRRLERDRGHAARRVRRRGAAPEPVRAGRPRAFPRHHRERIRADGGTAVSIHVARPGLLSTVQDLGRHGEQHLGVCPGGAMDPVALALANALVGNPVHAAALEVTILGPELRFEHVTLVALCGAEFDSGLPRNRPVLLAPGTRLSIGRAARGARAYLAVAGGIDVAPVLGSRSTFLPGRFGGLEGRALRRRDLLPPPEGPAAPSQERFGALKNNDGRSVRWSNPPHTVPDRGPVLMHSLEGQHFAGFDAASQRAFFDAVWP